MLGDRGTTDRQRVDMTILLIEYRVTDFDQWKAFFDQDPMGRSGHGVTSQHVYRDAGDPDHVMLSLEFRSAGPAEAFRRVLQPVWEVSGARQAWVLEEVE
jgi:hypothetical protein